MSEVFSLIASQSTQLPFVLSYIFMILAIIMALVNITFAPKDEFDTVVFAKRTLGSFFTVLVLILASVIPSLSGFIWAPITFICLVMIREITVALKFTGLDLTPLTIFVNIAISAVKGLFGKSPTP